MKILFITDLYPVKSGEKSSVKTLHNFVLEWLKQGHSVDVIKPNFIFNSFIREKPYYFENFYENQGVKILNLNFHTPFLFDVSNKIKGKIDVSSYDVILAHMPSGLIFANKIAKMFNKPLVCAVHHSDLKVLTDSKYSLYFKTQLEDAYKNAKSIACRSFVIQKKFNALMPEFASKTFVAPSGVKIETGFELVREPLSVLTCANLIKRKNVDKLILAVKDLPEFKLSVIGDGKELKKLKKIGKHCKFLGRLSQEHVLEEMKKSDIFVLPSVNETFGMVYLEAMSCGCITVCTKNEGIDGIIIDEKNGFLTEPTVLGIKETLIKVKKWHDAGAEKAHFFGAPTLEKIRENGYATVKNYTPKACAQKYLENVLISIKK